MNRPVNIEIEKENAITNRINHYMYRPLGSEKLDTFNKVLIKEKPETAVAFCRTKENVDLAYDFVREKGYSAIKIHGGMLQKDRIEAMEKFKRGNV